MTRHEISHHFYKRHFISVNQSAAVSERCSGLCANNGFYVALLYVVPVAVLCCNPNNKTELQC